MTSAEPMGPPTSPTEAGNSYPFPTGPVYWPEPILHSRRALLPWRRWPFALASNHCSPVLSNSPSHRDRRTRLFPATVWSVLYVMAEQVRPTPGRSAAGAADGVRVVERGCVCRLPGQHTLAGARARERPMPQGETPLTSRPPPRPKAASATTSEPFSAWPLDCVRPRDGSSPRPRTRQPTTRLAAFLRPPRQRTAQPGETQPSTASPEAATCPAHHRPTRPRPPHDDRDRTRQRRRDLAPVDPWRRPSTCPSRVSTIRQPAQAAKTDALA